MIEGFGRPDVLAIANDGAPAQAAGFPFHKHDALLQPTDSAPKGLTEPFGHPFILCGQGCQY
jgi:hypothetical protein